MKIPRRDCYPDGLFEFDTSDRSAPDNNPPAMLRLRVKEKVVVLGLISELLAMVANDDYSRSLTFSGKLTEVDE